MTKLTTVFSAAALLTSLLITSVPAQANKVYRWVDENGQVHFSSQPRRGVNEDTYNVVVDKVPAPITNEEEEKAAETISGVSKEEAEALCANAQEVKSLLSSNFNRPFTREDGTVSPLSDEERQAKLKEADDRIAKYCR
ncbi:DUF4124 domain-containing protein [Bacterioplanes sanyensis]|nr:DUF4124 domain-containing protein [Bacterioplanes sanyensis]